MSTLPQPGAARAPADRTARVVVLGAGFAGLGAAIRLQQLGIEDVVVLERAQDVGGTWRDNSYPGCACDVPSHLYSFSFAPNPDWTRRFAPQSEIHAYLRRCAQDFGVLPKIRFGTTLVAAAWDPRARRWRLETSTGTIEAEVLVSAAGPLAEPSVPQVPGLADFRGAVFHSARWDHALDLTGRRVVVVGTGASAVQFVPRIAPVVASLTLLQRTPAWVTPRKDRAIPAWRRALYRRVPALQQVSRAGVYASREIVVGALLGNDRLQRLGESGARKHLHAQVADPRLRALLTPDYRLGCKRVLLSDDFYPALARENVRVVPSGLAAVEPDGVVTAGGERIEADTVVFGTGFHVTDMPVADLVRDGQGRTLAERWGGHPTAYLGTTVPGYPNLFLLLGPNTGLGHNSIIYMIESQLRYVVAALKARGPEPGATIEPTPEAHDRWIRGVDDDMRRTVWVRGGCSSWYLDRTGRNSTLWPGSTLSFRRELSRFRREDHRIEPAPRPVPAAAAAVAS